MGMKHRSIYEYTELFDCPIIWRKYSLLNCLSGLIPAYFI